MNPLRRLASIPRLVRYEFARITSTTMGALSLLAIFSVPILYGSLFLWGNLDPFGNMTHYTVAVVNHDEGTERDGEVTNHGDQVVENLLDDGTFAWDVTNSDAAQAGLRNGNYGFVVTLPPTFSADLESAGGDNPRQAVIELSTNDAGNSIGTTAAERLGEAVRAAVASEVGDAAALMLLDGLAEVRDGMNTAIDGANQLADGNGKLKEGLEKADDASGRLAEGANELATGAATARDGSAELANGLSQLNEKTSELPAQASKLADGARQVSDGNAQIAEQVSKISALSAEIEADRQAIRAEVEQRLRERGVDEETIAAAVEALEPVDDRLSSVNAEIQSKSADVQRLADGAAQVADGAEKLSEAAPTLASAVNKAADGSAQLSAGSQKLADGTATLSSGAGQLHEGINTAHEASVKLADGSAKLRDGLVEGQKRIPESNKELRERQAAAIGDPVRVDQDNIAEAPNYGTGLAPFFIALCAWIGMYALFLIVKPFSRRAVTAISSPLRITIAGWATPALLGATQMLVLFLTLNWPVGMEFVHPLATVGIMMLASVTFASIIMALNIWFGSPGQFMALLITFVQLVGSGGTFPWQTLPEPFRTVHQYLPMSWVTDALRQTILGGNMQMAGTAAIALSLVLATALLISMLGVMRVTRTRIMRDLQPSVLG